MTSTLLELAKRCERAEGPIRKLFEEVFGLVFPSEQSFVLWRRFHALLNAEAWTDAAMMLIPPEANCHGYEVGENGVDAYISRNFVPGKHWYKAAYHKSSPALALTAACLRAMAAEKGEGK